MTYQAGDTSAQDIESLRLYTVSELRRIEDALAQYIRTEVALRAFSFAAYGGLVISQQRPFPDLGAGWEPITAYDASLIEPPKGIFVDQANGTLAVENPGVYLLTATVIFDHNETQQGRLTNLRLFDPFNAETGASFRVPTGRNTVATQISLAAPINFDENAVGNVFRLELGGGDTYTTVEMNSVLFGLSGVGEYRGSID